MKKQNISGFANRIFEGLKDKRQFPIKGQIALTYRCNLDCLHCYCKGSENEDKELSTRKWKGIIDEIKKEGCLSLCFTGGEPLLRGDFLDLYSYAKSKGFLVTIFTNGVLFTKEIIDYLKKSPPVSIEITLNGVHGGIYESISRVPGSFNKAITAINWLVKEKLNLFLRSNCLKMNKNEISRIKLFTKRLFGMNSKRFQYDPFIFPRLNGDKTSCRQRLNLKELSKVRSSDADIWNEYRKDLSGKYPVLTREGDYLYQCDSWLQQFFIDPYGRLKFCNLTKAYNVDLKYSSFRDGFYNEFPKLLTQKFKNKSKCIECRLRSVCYYCPARAYLETGNEESPVEYFCQLAKDKARQLTVYHKGGGKDGKKTKI